MKNEYALIGAPVLKNCLICGSPLKPQKVTLKQEKFGHTFIMERVPVYVCENCEETWIPDIILREFKNYTNLRSVKYGRRKKED